jgi:pyruvyltransferase
VAVGSIVEHLPARYTGIGVAHAATRADLTGATVLALRGPRTRSQVQIDGPEPVLADPGLLASDLLERRPDTTHKVGAIAHYADATFQTPPGARRIDITAPIADVIEQAAQCERIVTSSLHGLILADALGLARMWVRYPKVQGGGHKFHDHAEALGQPIAPNRWQTAPSDVVAELQHQLRGVMTQCVHRLSPS